MAVKFSWPIRARFIILGRREGMALGYFAMQCSRSRRSLIRIPYDPTYAGAFGCLLNVLRERVAFASS